MVRFNVSFCTWRYFNVKSNFDTFKHHMNYCNYETTNKYNLCSEKHNTKLVSQNSHYSCVKLYDNLVIQAEETKTINTFFNITSKKYLIMSL